MLATVAAFGKIKSMEICAHTGMHKTKVSRAVTTLRGRSLISSNGDPGDLRSVYLILTPEGRQVYNECASIMIDLARRIEDAIDPGDRDSFERVLRKLVAQRRPGQASLIDHALASSAVRDQPVALAFAKERCPLIGPERMPSPFTNDASGASAYQTTPAG